MSDSKDKKPGEIDNVTEDQQVSQTRRAFTKKGLLSAPILMAATSHPAFAANCLSNRLSGNLSDPNRGECGLGLSPGYWMNHPEDWPSPLIPLDGNVRGCVDCVSGTGRNKSWICDGGTRFNDIFSVKRDPDERSLYQILCTEQSEHEFGARHIVAAYINALYFNNPQSKYVLTTTQVVDLWSDPSFGGLIQTDLKTFLNSTWT